MSLGPLMIGLRGTALAPDEREWLASPIIGGVILFARNFASREQLEELIADVHAVREPALVVTVDQEGGRVQRFTEPFTRLPAARHFGHLYDKDPSLAVATTREVAWLMAAELRAVGVDMSFVPVVDLDRGLSEVIGDRALHEDAEVVARLAAAVNDGLEQAGMCITAKHFPSHAGSHSDSHTHVAEDPRSYEEIVDDLEPYKSLIERGLHSVMVGHVIFPALDPKPASFSSWWIESQLRGELGFSGAVISDDVSMVGAAIVGDLERRVACALEAGCDIVLACNLDDEIPALLDAFASYVDPAAQLRLMRLRGRDGMTWGALHDSDRWRRARGLLDKVEARPELKLEG